MGAQRWARPALQRRDLLLVGFALLVVFGGFRLLAAGRLAANSSDYDSYYRPVAERVLDGRGWTDPTGAPALRYPPGEPAVLAAALGAARAVGSHGDLPVDLADLVLVVGTGLGLFTIGRRLFGRSAAWFGTAAWALNPLSLYVFTQPGSEVPYTAVVVAVVILLLPVFGGSMPGAVRLVAIGALCGLASLTRPVGPLLLVAIAVCALARTGVSRRQRLAMTGVVLLVALAVAAPWLVWASSRHGGFVPLSTGGPPSVHDGLTFAVGPGGRARTWLPPGTVEVVRAARGQGASLAGLGAQVRFLWQQAVHHPAGLAGLVGVKAVRPWYGSESFRYEAYIALLQAAAVALIATGYATVRHRRAENPPGRRFAQFAVVLLVLNWLATVAVLPLFWYLMPSLTVASVLAGPALAGLGRKALRAQSIQSLRSSARGSSSRRQAAGSSHMVDRRSP